MAIQTTDISILQKVRSLGASFFQRYTPTKTLNLKIAEMNDVGLCDLIVATSTSQTTDFASLKVGDHVIIFKPHASLGNAGFATVATVGDLGVAAVIGDLYVVLRPAM
tara:strand:- start:468 stop:791 length:324 start_codon:yes stop_codon:yes gene_type:complete